MNTRRCIYCQALQLAEAQTCSRCGHELAHAPVRGMQQDSMPLAASHRAGHTVGLHPEDQPYQSSMMMAQRPASDEKEPLPRSKQAPEHIVFPSTLEASAVKARRTALLRQRTASNRLGNERDAVRWSLPARRNVGFSRRTISSLLTLSCIFLLLSVSIIAFVLIGRHATIATAVIQATPDTLRADDTFTLSGRGFSPHDEITFFHDNHHNFLDENGQPLSIHTDNLGAFSLQAQIPGDWGVGVHQIDAVDSARSVEAVTDIHIKEPSTQPSALQLSQHDSSFPAAAPGIISSQSIILSNTGGGQLSWAASSDQTWLSTSPSSGTFSGSQSVQIVVNRGNLVPQPYSGHITFTQKGNSSVALVVNVSMEVTPAPAVLTLSTTRLHYSASNSQDPADQSITLHNSGQKASSWSITTAMGNNSNWFTVSPDHDELAPGASETLIVSAHSYHLAASTYQGTIQFSGGTDASIGVVMDVVEAGNLVASPPALNFTALAGQAAANQTVTLQNSGGFALDWESSVATTDQGKWLQILPGSGSLVGGEQLPVTVSATAKGLRPGSYQGTITFTSSSGNIRQLAVALVVTAPPTPAINAQPGSLSFTAVKGHDSPAQTITVQNTGNTNLQCTIVVDGIDKSLLTVIPSQGNIKAGESITLTVVLHTPQNGFTLSTATILITGTAPDSTTVQQKVQVNISSAAPAQAATPLPAKTARAAVWQSQRPG
ncbi:BACON domain-containing protein [Dictyobacter kobayashii]|uniref:BACON domain-containing protein n=1 Tax=Dictyobacter kobayashii TaxID=2014872 RepID=A0A402AFZ9_9CHLR|nr:choice-of-anchor D domain-containing protein [Dictyobacter kobayashii]GCE18048.1 hypothetical protein KDK_18480 [Dictyobacter kobayashii]